MMPIWQHFKDNLKRHILKKMENGGVQEEILEDILARHKEEKKVLQNKILALKKTVPKNDKKKRKQMQDDITAWEKEIEEKHSSEIAQFKMTKISVNDDETPNIKDELDAEEPPDEPLKPQQRVSKAQRRRDKKDAAEKERAKAIAAQEEDIEKGARHLELVTIRGILKKKGLDLYSIPSDGNCLYGAVRHQLDIIKNKCVTVNVLRFMTAKYLRDNKEFFLPFLCDPNTGDMMSDEAYGLYCDKIESTSAWGGQIELQALCKSLQTPIHILQATLPHEIVQGEEFKGKPLILTYHRHMYSLGEHYNSTTQGSDELREE